MANTAKYVSGANALSSPVTLLTTELNSLGNNAASAASGAVNNLSSLDLYCDLILHLASLSPGTGAYVSIYILVSYDGGTNYPSATGSVLRNQASQLWCTIPLDTTASTAQDIVVRNLVMPPQKFKVVLDNQAGVALNASGNTLSIESYNINLNA